MSAQAEPARPAPPRPSRPRWIPWAVAAAVVLVGVLVFALTRGDDDDAGSSSTTAPAVKVGVPTLLSGTQLRAFGAQPSRATSPSSARAITRRWISLVPS